MDQSDERGVASQKMWWAAVWRGLVVDDAAKHYHAMRGAVWLLLYCIIHAERRSGVLHRKYETIGRDMHLPSRTVRAWLAVLRRAGYVSAQRTGRGIVIHISKWKSFSARKATGRNSSHE
jgi:DNA-binding transcriptional ArsR family regulator